MTALDSALSTALDTLPGGELLVGFSGGLDSSVLLHALAHCAAARARGLRAVHVHHGLHPEASAWAQRCEQVAAALQVPCDVRHVDVERDSGLGLEAAARAARHAAFAASMQPGTVLVLAHHRDDQVETVLLRLLHAAGQEGVAGMRAWRNFGPGFAWRPLLGTTRAALEIEANTRGIDAIEDPSNRDTALARNRMRHRVMPALREAWPDADTRIAAAAARLREDADALDILAAQHLDRPGDNNPTRLDLPALAALPDALRRRVIGQWLDRLGLPRPPPGIWRRIDVDLLHARQDATPRLAWRGAELRRYRHHIHALRERPAPPTDWRIGWDGDTPLTLPGGFGHLAFDSVDGSAAATPPPDLHVTARQGGERILTRGIHRPLRLRLQELALPPWQRERLPLLFDRSGALLAAGDTLLSDTAAAWPDTHRVRLRWTPDD